MRTYLTGLLLLLAAGAQAQYILKEADHQYALYNYSKAITLYEQAYSKKPTLHAAERLASCYRLTNNYNQAQKWYAVTTGVEGSRPENLLYYARALQNNGRYTEAKEQFRKYIDTDTAGMLTDNQKHSWLASCDSAAKWMNTSSIITVENMEDLNTPYADWAAVPYQGGVVFTSDRATAQPQKEDKPFLRFDGANRPDKDVYGWTGSQYLCLYYKNGEDSVTAFPFNAGTQYHVGAASFTEDERQVFFTLTEIPRSAIKGGGAVKTINVEIYSSRKDGRGQWMPPVPFMYNNVNAYSVGDPFITPTGDTLYFVSNMPGGSGGTDLYRCLRTGNGWTKPQNLTWLNTPGNERCPVIDRKGHLFFSSDGRIGLGGLDIYRGPITGVGAIVNMQAPVNSPQDDFSFTLDGFGNMLYMSSNRPGGKGGDDIYRVYPKLPPVMPAGTPEDEPDTTLTQLVHTPGTIVPVNEQPADTAKAIEPAGKQPAGPPKLPALQPAVVLSFAVEGTVYSKETKKPLENAEVTLFTAKSDIATVQTNEAGHYRFDLDTATVYMLHGQKENYMWDERKASTKGLTSSATLHQDLYLPILPVTPRLQVLNVYFDFDKANLRPEGADELNNLIKLLQDHPRMKIELRTHTDSRGDDAYNMKLSQKRSEAVVNYLISKGIDKHRLVAKGYGETRLLNGCKNGVECSEEEHQVNRRTEFKILKD